MDVSTRERWSTIAQQTVSAPPRVAEQLLDMMSRLRATTDGFSVQQVEHALHPATRVDRWDQTSFDREFTSLPLEHFAPMVRRVFERAKSL